MQNTILLSENNWKIPVICVGVILGVVFGCVLAWILIRRYGNVVLRFGLKEV